MFGNHCEEEHESSNRLWYFSFNYFHKLERAMRNIQCVGLLICYLLTFLLLKVSKFEIPVRRKGCIIPWRQVPHWEGRVPVWLLQEHRYSGTPAKTTVPPPLEAQLFPLANTRTEDPLLQPTLSLTPLCQGLWCEPEAALLLRESMNLAVLPTYLYPFSRFILLTE